MTPEQFAYWMQGFAELNAQPPSPEQWQSIREHLALVFEKKTPAVVQPKAVGIPQRPLDWDFGRAAPQMLPYVGTRLTC